MQFPKISSSRFWNGAAHRVKKWSYQLMPEIGPFRAILQRRRQAEFEKICHNNTWGCVESVSGPGSTLAATARLRVELAKLVKQLEVKAFLDAPCGDFNWFSHVQLPGDLVYTGGDIVAALVESNRRRYGGINRNFREFDIIKDPLPKADLWLCRDCLFHFPFKDIHLMLRKFSRSEIPYLLTTLNPDHQTNQDVALGGFRLLNLCAAPFGLPKPILVIEENSGIGVRKCLGMWERDQVRGLYANK
jgi:hypothetical protein